MASKNTQIKAKNSVGNEIQLSHTQTDCPIIDINAVERLHAIRPDLIDDFYGFFVEQTKLEAESRRSNSLKIIRYSFIERIGSLLLASFIAICGVAGSIYSAILGFEKLSWIIASVCIGTLAVAFLRKD